MFQQPKFSALFARIFFWPDVMLCNITPGHTHRYGRTLPSYNCDAKFRCMFCRNSSSWDEANVSVQRFVKEVSDEFGGTDGSTGTLKSYCWWFRKIWLSVLDIPRWYGISTSPSRDHTLFVDWIRRNLEETFSKEIPLNPRPRSMENTQK